MVYSTSSCAIQNLELLRGKQSYHHDEKERSYPPLRTDGDMGVERSQSFRRKLSNGIVPVVVSTSGNVNIWTCRCPLTRERVFPHYPKTRVKTPKCFGVTSGIFMTIHMTTSVPIRPLPQPSLLQLLTEPHRPKSNGLRPVDPLSQVQISDSVLQVR